MPAHDADDFLDQVAPGVVFVFVVAPLLEAVVFDVVEAAGVEVQAVGRPLQSGIDRRTSIH
ncbi:hypothetical protein [Pseudomonas syringae group genomosp. 3]|uniref:hypothetical protein n=1 Tax=Pseudomonas syringae group genomosp. 3 TaxID=251701 RepID=UPI0040540D42